MWHASASWLVAAELHLDRKELDKSKKVPDGAEVFLK
jgi:hypothetical protein